MTAAIMLPDRETLTTAAAQRPSSKRHQHRGLLTHVETVVLPPDCCWMSPRPPSPALRCKGLITITLKASRQCCGRSVNSSVVHGRSVGASMLVRNVCMTCRGCTDCDWRTRGTCRVMPPRRWAAQDPGQAAARHRGGWAATPTLLPGLAAQILLGHSRYSRPVFLQLAGPDALHSMCMGGPHCTPQSKLAIEPCTRNNT
jgi:hypothetical protein